MGAVARDEVITQGHFGSAVYVGAGRAVALIGGACGAGADVVSDQDLLAATALQHNAIAIEVADGHSPDNAALAAERQAVNIRSRVGAVQLDEQAAGAGAGLAIAVDGHGFGDGRQGR